MWYVIEYLAPNGKWYSRGVTYVLRSDAKKDLTICTRNNPDTSYRIQPREA